MAYSEQLRQREEECKSIQQKVILLVENFRTFDQKHIVNRRPSQEGIGIFMVYKTESWAPSTTDGKNCKAESL